MQAEFPNNVYTKPEPFNEDKMEQMLNDGAKSVTVFKRGSEEHKKATAQYKQFLTIRLKDMTKNQRKTARRKGCGK